MNNTWFTSDTHFGHSNIIAYCRRPFGNAEEMDRVLIENWNSRISRGDTVYHLGDLAWRHDVDALRELRGKLAGNVMVVPGNHDRVQRLTEAGFVVLPPIHEIKLVQGDTMLWVVLCHYPIEEWNGLFQGSIHLHGHTHGTVPTLAGVRRMDVGVDAQGYMPVSAAEVLARLVTVSGSPQ